MKVSTHLDQVELELINLGKSKLADRGLLLKHLRYDLDTLMGIEEWDWAAVYLDPAVSMTESVRDYDLPANFGDNFMRGAGTDGYVCKLDDTHCQVLLTYESPAVFYSRDLSSESNSKPSRYTITNKTDGSRQITVSPPPDDTDTYTIVGLYIPSTYELHFEAELPPIPRNADVLKWMLLKRYDPKFEADYAKALVKLYGNMALQRQAKLAPNLKQGY